MIRSTLLRARWLIYGLLIAASVGTLWAQEAAQFNRGIAVTQGNLVISRGYLLTGATLVREFRTPTTVTSNSATTYTAAQILAGDIIRSGSNATDVLPTAADLAAAIPGVAAGHSFWVMFDMTAAAGMAMTLNGASTGVTYSGGCSTAVSTSDAMPVLITFTSTTAYRATCVNGNT